MVKKTSGKVGAGGTAAKPVSSAVRTPDTVARGAMPVLPEAAGTPPLATPTPAFPIVGIGASAGGLEEAMNPPDEKKPDAAILRSMAAADLARHPVPAARPVDELLHELQVHQVELEMQNEALHVAQRDLEASRDRYVDLYDFAPIGYLTLNANGMIEELNLTAATLLGMERKKLLQRAFLTQVRAADQPRWAALFARLKAGEADGSVELALQRGDGTVFQARLDGAPRKVGAGGTAILLVMRDISSRKAAEAAQLQQIDELERFNRVAVDRELAMIGLKRQVNALSRELGRAPPFALDFADAPGAGEPQ